VRRRKENERDTQAVARGLGSSPRLYQRALEILESQIENGEWPAEATLTETGIAARLGISRAPARRALAELEKTGLIARSDTRGYIVVGGRRRGRPRRGDKGSVETTAVKLTPQPSWERIYGTVESEIIARISFASWRVNEAELARHFGVSRTVARDVVSRLQQRGIVQKDDSSRWYAPALTAEHVGELYELRWILEPIALKKAAPNLPEGLLPRLHKNLTDAISRATEIGGETLDQLEHDLHVTLLSYCRNRALMQAIAFPQSLIIAHSFLYRWTSRLFPTEPFLPEHLEVLERLLAGKVADAAKALEKHLRVSRDRAMTRIQVIASGSQPDPLPYLERLGSAP